MDQLEKIIAQQKHEIQNDFPHDGHFERFEMKLDAQKRKKPIRILTYVSTIAAALVVALFIFTSEKSNSSKFTLSKVSEQYADVEFYYTNSINKQIGQLKYLDASPENNDRNVQMLLEELKEYDTLYDQLCIDLEATPNDQRVINAMIVYYQTKLEVITKIVEELDKQRINKEDHENINI